MVNVNYREVKRKAAVGERIKIVAAGYTGGHYENGDVFTITRIDHDGYTRFMGRKDYEFLAHDREYVVLEPITAVASPLSVDPLYAAFRQFVVDNAAAIRAILPELESQVSPPSPAPLFTVTDGKLAPITPKLTRAQVIAKATADVAELLRIGGDSSSDLPEGTPFENTFYKAEFHVNRDKRAVTALIRYVYGDTAEVRAKAIAKCSPADVFHAEIGKAIALRKALGLAVPTEYTDAPQPEKAYAGAVIRKVSGAYVGETRVIASRPSPYPASYGLTNGMNTAIINCAIIDDTDVDYGAVEAKEAA